MYDFDRFQPPEETDPIARCTYCGADIYAGDDVTGYANGDITHRGCEDAYVTLELGLVRYTV